MNWQPVKMAPLNRKLIVYGMTSVSGGPRTLLARYWPAYTLEAPEGCEEEDFVVMAEDGTAYYRAGWYEENSADDAPYVSVYPTHWMPLPGAPSDD